MRRVGSSPSACTNCDSLFRAGFVFITPMNVQLHSHDALNASVTIDLTLEDYQEKVQSEMKRLQRTANVKGFRPGKAPVGMINKLYGKAVLADVLQTIASDTMNDYVQKENLDILGYPISSTRMESDIDIENKTEFRFAFDLGLAPQFELNVSSKDKLDKFEIEVGDAEIDKDIEYARQRQGGMEDTEVSAEADVVYMNLTELDEKGKSPLEGGVENKPVSVVPEMITDAKTKKALIGLKVGDTVTVDLKALFNDNETVISSSLGLPKEGLADLNAKFQGNVSEIKRRTLAELNEDYFKQMFGAEDYPKTEAEYRERIKLNLERYYANEADLWIDHEIGHLLLSKHDLAIPDEFLKRWLMANKPDDYNEENIEEKYAEERSALQRRLVIDKIAADTKIEASAEDIMEEAKVYYAGMYRQYGMNIDLGDAFLTETVQKRMSDREFVSQMADRVVYRKAYDHVKSLISFTSKKISVEKYFEHVNKHKHEHGE